jgi:zinc protease
VVAGDIDTDRARELVWKYFADIPPGAPIERPNVVEPPIPGEVRDVVHDRIQLPAVVQAYRMPARGTEHFYAVDLVNRLLSNGSSARLNKALRDEQGSALQTGAFSLAFEDPGLSVLYAVANAGVEADVLERVMDAEVRRLAAEGPTKAEMDKLRTQLETEAVQERIRVSGRAAELATARMLLGDTALVNTELDRYLALDRTDVQRAAAEWFDPGSRVVLHYQPMPERR